MTDLSKLRDELAADHTKSAHIGWTHCPCWNEAWKSALQALSEAGEEFDEQAALMYAQTLRTADLGGFWKTKRKREELAFVIGACWQHDQSRLRLAALQAENEQLIEALRSARGWVSTHAMQTYSRVASKEVENIDRLLEALSPERKE